MADPFKPMSEDTRLSDLMRNANPAPDAEMEELMFAHPWLATLEPYSVEWELVWFS
jgi:hypothetical protein